MLWYFIGKYSFHNFEPGTMIYLSRLLKHFFLGKGCRLAGARRSGACPPRDTLAPQHPLATRRLSEVSPYHEHFLAEAVVSKKFLVTDFDHY